MTFIVEKVALTEVFLLVFRFSSVHIIPTVLHIVLYPHVVLTNGTSGKDLGCCQKATLFRKSEAFDRQDMSLSFFLYHRTAHKVDGQPYSILRLKYNLDPSEDVYTGTE